MAAYTDNFNTYSDGVLVGKGSWISGLNTMRVIDHEVVEYTDDDNCAAIFDQELDNDQYAQIKLVLINNEEDNFLGPIVRASGSGGTFKCYFLIIAYNVQYLGKFDATGSGWSSFGNADTTAPSANDIFKLEVDGTTLTAYKNGSVYTAVGTSGVATDSDLSSGKAGLFGYGWGPETYGDDFECSALNVPVCEQEGFQFRKDNGDNIGSQDEDAEVATETNTRLRILIDATDDPSSAAATLQYRRVGDPDSEWRNIE